MAGLLVEFQLLAPTCVADRPAAPGQITATLDYLSGTVIRGGIAARWLAGRRYADPLDPAGISSAVSPAEADTLDDDERRRFGELFLDGAVRYGVGVPIADRLEATWIVPRTAWSEKRNGGWTHESGGGPGVQDVLARLLKAELLRADPAELKALDELIALGQPFAHEKAEDVLVPLVVRRRLIGRTAINPVAGGSSRRVAAEGQLFSFEAIETGQRFAAAIVGPDDRLRELREKALFEDAILAMGCGRSRGSGQAWVRSVEPLADPARDAAALAALADDFSHRAGLDPGGATVYLPVTLETDVMLRDHYLLPSSSADPRETLGRYLPDGPPMTLATAVQSTRWVGGWDMIRQIPRAPQLVVEQGSVWVFSVARPDLDEAIQWWLRAEREGLGKRRNLGFGRVRLLHPLHAEERAKW